MMDAQELLNFSLSCSDTKSMAGRADRNSREVVPSRRDLFTDLSRRLRISCEVTVNSDIDR